jgi:hypothetical protein
MASGHIPKALMPALGPILEQIGSLTERFATTTESWRRSPKSTTHTKPSTCARSRELGHLRR